MAFNKFGGGYKLKESEMSQSAIEARFLVVQLFAIRRKNITEELLNWINLESVAKEKIECAALAEGLTASAREFYLKFGFGINSGLLVLNL
jgi:hypothetical protein